MFPSQKRLLFLILLAFQVNAKAQILKRALFIGNSYTAVNDLPLLVSKIAHAQGDSLFYDSNTPGGFTFAYHFIDATTIAKITHGNWDYVALQAQSQEPSFPPAQVASNTLPYAHNLDSLIHRSDSCAETVFYMTWGRKNGDASNCSSYPVICTYNGMQQRLRESYLLMAQQNNASVAPVGAAWYQVRNQNPSFDLYQADESHPSIHGSYLAACVFYSTFFQKPVSSLNFTAGISIADAQLIQQQSNALVFDSLSNWFGFGKIPFCSFQKHQQDDTVHFHSNSINATSFNWNFGDGNTSTLPNPTHIYSTSGDYLVSLQVQNDCKSSTFIDTVSITTAGIHSILDDEKISIQASGSEIRIKSNANINNYRLEIFNALGQLLLSSPAQPIVNLALTKGIYFCKLINTANANSATIKFSSY